MKLINNILTMLRKNKRNPYEPDISVSFGSLIMKWLKRKPKVREKIKL